MDKSVAELCVAEPDQGLWASVGVRLPLDDSDKGDVQVYLSMAFCTFLVKCEGKGSLPFAGKLCFVAPSDSPLPSGPSSEQEQLSSESPSEAHSSPMSGRVKNRVLGPGPGAIPMLGWRSLGAGGRRECPGLATPQLLLPAPATDGSAVQTPPGPESGRAGAARWVAELATPQPPPEGVGGTGKGRGWTLAALGLPGNDKGVPTASVARLAVNTLG